MRNTWSAKKTAKAKLSGFVADDSSPKNKKIVFDEDDEHQSDVDLDEGIENTEEQLESLEKDNSDDDDDAVEEVKGSMARESTQKTRDAERKVANVTTVKKKRTKKDTKKSNCRAVEITPGYPSP